jgi:secreted trypsin-like serine protease
MFDLFLSQIPLRTLRLCEINLFFSRRGAGVAENLNVEFALSKNTFAFFATWRELIVFFSRKGAKHARNFYDWFILIPNTSANSASLRDYIYFSLAEAQGSQRT